MRGTIFSYGYAHYGIEYDRLARKFGESKFPFDKLMNFAVDGIISQSVLPLRIATYFGLLAAVATAAASGTYIMARIFGLFPMPAGFTTTTVLILFSISLNAILLGVIGEYLGRIYIQLKRRPMAIVQALPHPDGCT